MSVFRRFGLRVRPVLLSVGIFCAVPPAIAQNPAVLHGIVTDDANNPVYGARVSISGTSLVATTDEDGQFRIAGPLPGSVELVARRLGFSPATQQLAISQQESLNRAHIRLSSLPSNVAPVVIQADRVQYSGRLAGYYERLRRRSNGHFISREEIDKKNHRSLSQLLGQTPGVNAMRSRTGVGVVRMRGRSCRPLVWLDGTPMPAGEVDLDAFSASTLHGIEMYLGSSNAPLGYTGSQGISSCGTILLWSRGRDTEVPRSRANRQNVDLEGLVSSLSVYTAEQVDKPAVAAGARPVEVAYPAALFASGVSGSVVAEFVVDTAGRVEGGTVTIVSSAHPSFSQAVTEGLKNAVYTPAIKNGKAVRQIVYQSFAFAAGTGKSRKDGGS